MYLCECLQNVNIKFTGSNLHHRNGYNQNPIVVAQSVSCGSYMSRRVRTLENCSLVSKRLQFSLFNGYAFPPITQYVNIFSFAKQDIKVSELNQLS